uniref:Uncharacterized protein n=1 Tax=Arundo donax TaxID=35708 RepID=A0A0A9GWF8_ARUDO
MMHAVVFVFPCMSFIFIPVNRCYGEKC